MKWPQAEEKPNIQSEVFLSLSLSPLRGLSQIPFLKPYLLSLSISRDHFPHATQDALKIGSFSVSLEKRVCHPKRWRSLFSRICSGKHRVPSLYSCWPEWKRGLEETGGEPRKNNLGSLCGFLTAECKRADYNEDEPCNSSQRGLLTGGISRWG